MAMIICKEGRKFALDAVNNLDLRVCLFVDDITPTADTEFADLTEADFSGYTNASITWNSIGLDGSGRARCVGDPVTFSHDGGGTANDVYLQGIARNNGGTYELLSIERLSPAPAVFNTDDDVLVKIPRLYVTEDTTL